MVCVLGLMFILLLFLLYQSIFLSKEVITVAQSRVQSSRLPLLLLLVCFLSGLLLAFLSASHVLCRHHESVYFIAAEHAEEAQEQLIVQIAEHRDCHSKSRTLGP